MQQRSSNIKEKRLHFYWIIRLFWRCCKVFLHICLSSIALKSVFFIFVFPNQSPVIWAAPLMKASAVGSETKMETCTGRRHLIRQVIEGLRTFILFCLNWNEKKPRFFRDIHTKANARTRIRTISAVRCYSITGQDENYSREVTCHVCRLGLCATKRCEWEVDYATRQWYLWLTLNGNATLFFFLSFLGGSDKEKTWWIMLRSPSRDGVKTKQCSVLARFKWH